MTSTLTRLRLLMAVDEVWLLGMLIGLSLFSLPCQRWRWSSIVYVLLKAPIHSSDVGMSCGAVV